MHLGSAFYIWRITSPLMGSISFPNSPPDRYKNFEYPKFPITMTSATAEIPDHSIRICADRRHFLRCTFVRTVLSTVTPSSLFLLDYTRRWLPMPSSNAKDTNTLSLSPVGLRIFFSSEINRVPRYLTSTSEDHWHHPYI